jgi:hypothetical protein
MRVRFCVTAAPIPAPAQEARGAAIEFGGLVVESRVCAATNPAEPLGNRSLLDFEEGYLFCHKLLLRLQARHNSGCRGRAVAVWVLMQACADAEAGGGGVPDCAAGKNRTRALAVSHVTDLGKRLQAPRHAEAARARAQVLHPRVRMECATFSVQRCGRHGCKRCQRVRVASCPGRAVRADAVPPGGLVASPSALGRCLCRARSVCGVEELGYGHALDLRRRRLRRMQEV